VGRRITIDAEDVAPDSTNRASADAGRLRHYDRTRERLRGLVEGKSEPTTLLFFEGEVSAEAGARGTRRALDSTPRPTAAIGLSDVFALGAIFEANRQNLTLPSDLSIMGFDNLEWSEECCPRLTTLALPTRKLANAAARAIVAKIEADQPIKPIRFDGHLIVGESTAPPRANASARIDTTRR